MTSRVASSLVVTRRELFTLLGSAAALVACGGKSSAKGPITSRSTTGATGSDSASAVGGSAGAAGSAGSSGGAGSGGSSGPVARIGGTHATGADAMTVADAQREAQVANGHWLGGWHDATGASGNSDVLIAIDATSRTATATVSFDGPLLGASVPSVTYDIDLLSFMMTADSYDVASPQFGQVTIVPGGSTSASGSAKAIPGHPEIDHIDVNGSKAGTRVDITYTAHYTDGHSVKGAMAWTTSGTRATPAALGTAGAPAAADIASGAYAAGLLDASVLKTIFGEPFEAPESNGGNPLYANGIATSNAQATAQSGDFQLAYTIYVGKDAAATTAYWATVTPRLPTVPGPWQSAYYYPGQAFYAKLPTSVLEVRVVSLKAAGAPTDAQAALTKQWSIQAATALANALKTG